MRRSEITQRNESVTILGSRVVISGGTQGIGEGVAYRFAKAGAEVWIVGRNESKGSSVVQKLNEISIEQAIAPPPEHHFIQADLSLVAQAKRVAEDIRVRAGSQGVDYLVMCQGGTPNPASWVLTSESHEKHYAVQVLSRFVLAYLLASNLEPTVKSGVMSIMGPGRFLRTPDYDDLELFKAKAKGGYGRIAIGSRDANVMDAFIEELAEHNPTVSFTHVYPLLVKTNNAANSGMPWWFVALANFVLFLFGCSTASYAEVPFYMLANPEGRAVTSKARFWNHDVERIESHWSVREKGNRIKVWNHLMEMLDSSN